MFYKLKGLLVTPPVLKVVEPDKPYILQTNVLELGLGAVLSQLKDGEQHPVTFTSRKLLPREKIHSITETECLAIVWYFNCFMGICLDKSLRLRQISSTALLVGEDKECQPITHQMGIGSAAILF